MLTILLGNSEHYKRLLIFDTFFATLLATFWFLVQSSVFVNNKEWVTATILVTLFLVTPTIYWLFCRKCSISSTAFLILFVVALAFVSSAIPDRLALLEADSGLANFVMALQLGGMLATVVGIIYLAKKRFVALRTAFESSLHFDRKERLNDAFTAVFAGGWFANSAMTECTTLLYLLKPKSHFVSAKNQWDTPIEASKYSYHEKSGVTALLMCLCLLIVIEITAFHFLLSLLNPFLAWLASASSAYLLFQIFGHVRSLNVRPHYIHNSTLHLRNGLIQSTDIPLVYIEQVELNRNSPKHETEILGFSIPASHNVVLRLKKEQICQFPYGIKKPFQVALFYVDTPDRFLADIRLRIDQATASVDSVQADR